MTETAATESSGIGAVIRGLIEELIGEDKTVIEIPFGDGFFNISSSTVTMWKIMAVLIILCIIMSWNLKVYNISKRQAITESFVVGLRNLVSGFLGPTASEYTDFLVATLILIGASNLSGVFGATPPTMDLNVTIALALVSITLVEAAGIRKRKFGGWLKSFTKPVFIITPMNILEIGIRPLSLCMRLFGNVLGATIIMELLKKIAPIIAPAVLSVYFDFFDGLLQAYVFIFLTSLYIKEATE
ncbi:MAG: F0F1 ATP synthase subunit A [Butyrivibrio sp.]|uniref:F0F1 ATP synthase subunit A n=1 Tax=Butyrivibrio sp. TaxID=28121 RepID=UPI0025E774A2|nr:FoF1 ATP synthase subunit a [Butyrivibrio sp.]MCR5770227.1 F0F1 ATP synthase subunit A [Butyrivibrio sp.]